MCKVDVWIECVLRGRCVARITVTREFAAGSTWPPCDEILAGPHPAGHHQLQLPLSQHTAEAGPDTAPRPKTDL